MSKLIHYSHRRVKKVHSVPQHNRPYFKPSGFWVSVEGNDDGWREWCQAESFGLERLSHEHEVILDDKANILYLKNAADIDEFHAKYKAPTFTSDKLRDRLYIDWARVAKDYQGIIIAPYCYERRLDSNAFWYYAWDCASGCIWDADAIKSVRLLPKGSGTRIIGKMHEAWKAGVRLIPNLLNQDR